MAFFTTEQVMRIVLSTVFVLATFTANVRLLVDGGQLLSDPFDRYTSELVGQLADETITEGTACITAHAPIVAEPCTRLEGNQKFSFIAVYYPGGVINSIRLSVRNDAILVGDLIGLWGRPHLHPMARRGIVLCWPERGIRALASLNVHRQYSMMQPVQHITFVGPFLSDECRPV